MVILLTRKVGNIPNHPYSEESKGYPISTPRFVIQNQLRNLEAGQYKIKRVYPQ
jgi:hypothetical protein